MGFIRIRYSRASDSPLSCAESPFSTPADPPRGSRRPPGSGAFEACRFPHIPGPQMAAPGSTCSLEERRVEGGDASNPTVIFVLTLKSSPNPKKPQECGNTFYPAFVRDVHAALDEAERRAAATPRGPRALVVTGGEGNKFFCNGHDIAWLRAAVGRGGDEAADFIDSFYVLLSRLLTFPLMTVAALNGHAFAGGLLLALACDYRVAKDGDKGMFCMNEIDMAMMPAPANDTGPQIKPGMFVDADAKMTALLRARLEKRVIRDVFLRGLRLNAVSGEKLGVVDSVVAASSPLGVVEAAVAYAAPLALKSPYVNARTVRVLKTEMATRELLEILQPSRPAAGKL